MPAALVPRPPFEQAASDRSYRSGNQMRLFTVASSPSLPTSPTSLAVQQSLTWLLSHGYTEIAMAALVLLYILVIFAESTIVGVLADRDATRPDQEPAILTLELRQQIRFSFWVVDVSFLSFFVSELLLWVFWESSNFLRSRVKLVDAILLIITFGLSLAISPLIWELRADQQRVLVSDGVSASVAAAADQEVYASLSAATQVFRLLRIVRLLRLFPVIFTIQERTASAALDRETEKMSSSGSNVERALMILKRLKRGESLTDRENVNYIMEMIIFEELYAVDVNEGKTLTKEQEEFINSQGAVTQRLHRQRQSRRSTTSDSRAGSRRSSVPFENRASSFSNEDNSGDQTPSDAGSSRGTSNRNCGSPEKHNSLKGARKGRNFPVRSGSVAGSHPNHGPASRLSSTQWRGRRFSNAGMIGSAPNVHELLRRGKDPSEPAPSSSTAPVGDEEDLLLRIDGLLDNESISPLLPTIEEWDFNVFRLQDVSGGRPLTCMVMHLVRVHALDEKLSLNVVNLMRFMGELERGYRDVPFHNKIHAADVTHGTAFLLMQDQLRELITPLDLYTMILAAAMHDYRHPGLTNAFLVETMDECAILYNDKSVLENYHAAASFRLMLDPACNPFGTLTKEEYIEARQTIVEAILGTDLKQHFHHLTQFRTLRAARAFVDPQRHDLRTLLAIVLHAADVSNLAKPWDLSLLWVISLFQEQFLQGDMEKSLGLTPSPLTDREKTDIPKSEIGFANFMILPYFEELCSFLGQEGGNKTSESILQHIHDNIKVWTEQGVSAMGDAIAKLRPTPPLDFDAVGRRRKSDSSAFQDAAGILTGALRRKSATPARNSRMEKLGSKDASPKTSPVTIRRHDDPSPLIPRRKASVSDAPTALESAEVAEPPPPGSSRALPTAESRV